MKKPFALLWILGAGVLIFSWIYLPALSKYHDLKLQQDELDEQIAKFKREVESTREERNLLKNDPEYLEKIIRDEMGLVKPGEIVYKFVQDVPEAVTDEISSPDPDLPEVALPSPALISSGITVEARPVAVKPAPVSPKKPLPISEPVYPRRETR